MRPQDFVRPIQRRPDDLGFIYVDFTLDEGTPYVRRGLIQESTASLTAYVGVLIDHPLAGQDYNEFLLDVHGGLTFGQPGDGQYRPAGWYWYGWDYAHFSDLSKLDLKYLLSAGELTMIPKHDWTIPEVLEHLNDALRQLRGLMED